MKLKVYTLAYCPIEIITKSIEQVYAMKTLDWDHYIVYRGWPIEPDKNKQDLKALAHQYGAKFVEVTTTGITFCQNILLKEHMNIQESDVFLGIDADAFPKQKGFDEALFKVHQDPKIAWASLWIEHAHPNEFAQRPHRKAVINGINVNLCNVPHILDISMYKWNWISKAGGFHQPCAVYGGVEVGMWNDFKSLGMELCVLTDYTEDYHLCELWPEIYQQWKRDHVLGKFPENFDKYLEAKK